MYDKSYNSYEEYAELLRKCDYVKVGKEKIEGERAKTLIEIFLKYGNSIYRDIDDYYKGVEEKDIIIFESIYRKISHAYKCGVYEPYVEMLLMLTKDKNKNYCYVKIFE